MRKKMTQLRKRIAAFHDDERGEQTMSTIMLLAIAAMVVAALIVIGKWVYEWWTTQKEKIEGEGGIT